MNSENTGCNIIRGAASRCHLFCVLCARDNFNFFTLILGYYLADPGIQCTDTCENLIDNFICSPFMSTYLANSSEPFKDPRIPSNHSQHYNLTCVNTNEPVYNKSSHPSYDMVEQSCDGFIAVPRMMECDSETNITENEQRLCYCDDEGNCLRINFCG